MDGLRPLFYTRDLLCRRRDVGGKLGEYFVTVLSRFVQKETENRDRINSTAIFERATIGQ